MVEDIFEKRRREKGLVSTSPVSSSGLESAFESRRMEKGLMPDTRPKAPTPQTSFKTSELLSSIGVDSSKFGKTEVKSLPMFARKPVTQPSTGIKTPMITGFHAATGDKQALSDYKKLTGFEFAPLTDARTQYEKEQENINNSNMPSVVKGIASAGNFVTRGNPVGRFLSQATTVPGVSLSTPDSTGNKIADKAGKLLGDYVSPLLVPTGAPLGSGTMAAPYEAAGKLLNTGVGQKTVNAFGNGLSKVPFISKGAGQNLARVGLTEGLAGTIQNPAQALVNDSGRSTQDLAKDALIGGAAGLGLGMAGEAVSMGLSRLFKKNGIPDIEIQEILSLPEANRSTRMATAADRSITPMGTDPIANPYTFGLPDSTPATRSKISNAAEGRAGVKEIDQAINDLHTKYEQQVIDEYKYLKQSMSERGGVKQGQLNVDVNSDVVGRVGRQSNNPLWYQQFYKANNKVPSNKELYKLARDRVDNGFADEGGNVPSWKADNNYDETLSGYASARETLNNSVREVDPAIQVVNQPIISKELKDLRAKEPKVVTPFAKIANENVAPQAKMVDPYNPDSADIPSFLKSRNTPPEKLVVNKLEPKASAKIEKEVEEVFTASKEPKVRERLYNALDAQEKAARERMSKRKGRLNSMPVDEWADMTIIAAAKMAKGTIKLVDFTEAMVKEFGEKIRPQIDKLYISAKNELHRQQQRVSKEGKDATAFNEQDFGDADTFAQKVSKDIKKKKTPFSERMEKIRTQFVDDLAPLEGLEKNITGKVASAEDSLYKSGRLYKGTPAKANQIVVDRLTPIVKAVEDAGYNTDELGYYALARHAQDVNAAGMKSGFTNREIENIIQKYGTPEMESARKSLIKISDDMLLELTKSGVVSKELTTVLRDRWKNYVPLFRDIESDAVDFVGGLSSSLANVAAPIKTLKGSEKNVIDPLENMVKNIFQSTNAAERNKVAKKLADLATKDADQTFIRKLDPLEEVGRKNVVNVKVNGENIKYEVQPEVYKAMLNLDQESSNMLIKILQKPASILRSGATLTPEFSLRNPMRDVMQAFVVSKSGFNPAIDFPVGLIQSISKGKLYKQWVNDMGDFGNVMSMDRKVHKEALERVLGEKPSKKFVNVLTGKSLLNILRAIADTTESATKVGEYRAALRKGTTPQEAAYRSRDIMDFGRSGSSIRQTNKVVAFLNANIQGKSKLIRAIKEDPIGVTARAFAGVTVPSIAVFVMQKNMSNEVQKNTITESPEWLRNSFWLIPVPGTDQVARIPKPFDLAAIFANTPERAMSYIYDNDREAFDNFAKQSLSESALPSQITGLIPLIEGMADYSFFRQGAIIPRGEAGREFKDQYDPVNTTETAKLLAKGAETITGGKGAFKNFSSPRIMDNTIKGLTAGMGTYATSAIDSLLEGKVLGKKVFKPIITKPVKPEKRIEQRPLAKAFLVDPLQGGKSMDKFYTELDKLGRQKQSANFNGTKLERDKQVELKFLNKAADKMSDVTKKIRLIERSVTLTAKQKRDQIEPLIALRNKLSEDQVNKFNIK